MNPQRIFKREEEILRGEFLEMSLAGDKTFLLWKKFKVENRDWLSNYKGCYYSVQVFPAGYSGGAEQTFTKWVAVDDKPMSSRLSTLTIPKGRYAEFEHHGTPETFGVNLKSILFQWLPKSGYQLDLRPHLSIMENDYSTKDNKAIEKILIPIKKLL